MVWEGRLGSDLHWAALMPLQVRRLIGLRDPSQMYAWHLLGKDSLLAFGSAHAERRDQTSFRRKVVNTRHCAVARACLLPEAVWSDIVMA